MNGDAERERVARHLGRLEPRFRNLHAAYGPPPWRRTRNSFRSLARAIVYQQVAGKAAEAVFGRFRGLYRDGQTGGRFPTPAQVEATPFDELRGAGLSRQKATYLHDLAAAYLDGRIRPRDFNRSSDEEILKMLTAVRGIGPWTAEIFLMFNLLRPDVLPLGDYGIQQGFALLYDLDDLPHRDRMLELAEPWRPHRSQACWYLWRLLEDSRS